MSSYLFQGDKRVWTPRDVEENRVVFSAQRQETGIQMPDNFKPTYIASAEHELEKWDLNQTLCLLRLYGSHRCLWDIRDEDHRNRKLRKAALIDIAAAMGGRITRSQVARKINVLRATYRYERRRIKLRMRKGIGAKTKLKWFALADSFLREMPKIGKLRKRHKKHTQIDSDLENEMVLTIDPDVTMHMEDHKQEYFTSSIKLEDEQTCHIKGTSLSNELQSQNFECTDLVSESSSQNFPLKPKWTLEHSLKFVDTLKTQPALWSKDVAENMENQNLALEHIAKVLHMPISRVKVRLKKFNKICKEVSSKKRCNPNYKPQFAWWSLAENFISNEEAYLYNENFVDANAAIAATPMKLCTGKEDFLESRLTPINPIPSLSAPSMLKTGGEDKLEQVSSTIAPTNYMDFNVQSPSSQPTRLIWNGLADDLLEGKWSLKHSVKFLRLYGTHRCLWDLNNPDYRSRELRSAAIQDIAAAMGYGLNAEYVAKKIKIFRITYMQHRKRMLEATKSGQEPEIQLRWFPLADSFLRPHIGLRSIKEQEHEIPQFDYQYVMANLNLIDLDLLNDFRDKIPKTANEILNKSIENTSKGIEIA